MHILPHFTETTFSVMTDLDSSDIKKQYGAVIPYSNNTG
jgi:hypothetical protein